VAGVILNRVGSDRHLQLLRNALDSINMPILGVFQRERDIELPSRHLGLVPTGEVSAFKEVAQRLAVLGERCFDWEKLVGLGFGYAQPTGGLSAMVNGYAQPTDGLSAMAERSRSRSQGKNQGKSQGKGVRIAIAQDSAFNFYYRDNFEQLEAQGAELVYWSPLKDKTLPKVNGLYFGGGFPEVFAAELSANEPIMTAVREAITRGIPTYAECGGLMYLSEAIVDFDGESWPMAGVIPQTVKMGGRLALGYRQAMAIADGPLLKLGQTVTGHEFHKSSIVEPLERPIYKTRRYWGETDSDQLEGYGRANLQASYVHLHWGDRPDIAQRFVSQCLRFQQSSSSQLPSKQP
jgi:cobyrinic acid a,c-diamide synthase